MEAFVTACSLFAADRERDLHDLLSALADEADRRKAERGG